MYAYGFHTKEGLYFQRDTDGSVIVRKMSGDRLIFKTTLTPDTWASVVASVSKNGETTDTFRAAQGYHMDKPAG